MGSGLRAASRKSGLAAESRSSSERKGFTASSPSPVRIIRAKPARATFGAGEGPWPRGDGACLIAAALGGGSSDSWIPGSSLTAFGSGWIRGGFGAGSAGGAAGSVRPARVGMPGPTASVTAPACRSLARWRRYWRACRHSRLPRQPPFRRPRPFRADPVVLLASDPGHSALPVRTKRELSLAHPPPVEEDSNLHRGRSSNPDRGVAIGRGRASSSGRLQGLIPVSVVVCGLWRVVARQFVLRKRRPNLTRALFLQIFAVDQAR